MMGKERSEGERVDCLTMTHSRDFNVSRTPDVARLTRPSYRVCQESLPCLNSQSIVRLSSRILNDNG